MRTTPFVILILSITFLTGCKPENNKSEEEKAATTDSTHLSNNSESSKNIYYRFPSAKEMLTYIKTDKLEYRTDIVNPADNIMDYHNTKAKTLNLGIYIADLSYMILFNKTQNAEQYFNVIFNLTRDLRIKIPEEEKLVERISDNIYIKDSLINIADQYQNRIIDHLISTGKERTLAVISTGSYIEGLYISLNLISDFEEDHVAIDKIIDQKYAFINLTRFAQNFEKDLNTKFSLDYLNEINAFFKKLPVVEEKTHVKRTDEHKLRIEGGKNIKINRKQFEELKNKVTSIRTEIVNNKMN